MKKERKLFRSTLFAACFFTVLLTSSVNAANVTINHSVPTMQKYVTLSMQSKSSASSNASVTLTKKEPDAVTFSARALKSNGTWGEYQAGTVVTKTNMAYSVPYEYYLAAGTVVQARFRNHNWSMNSNQIEGIFDYR